MMGNNQEGFRSLTQMAIEIINAYCNNQAVRTAVRNSIDEQNIKEKQQET